MKCLSCGLTEPRKDIHTVESKPRCRMCEKTAVLEVSDLLLHRHGELVPAPRISQIKMAEAIEKAFNASSEVPQTVLVEAPVGTGKSFAYSIPAILSGQRTIISTAKKELQHQLFEQDLPRIKKALNHDFRFALMKGKSNYACLQKLSDFKPTAEQTKLGVDVQLDALFKAAQKDADLTKYNGDLPDIHFNMTAEDCLGRKCPAYDKCQYIVVRARAKEAHVLVVNHHVTALDLRHGPGLLTGPYSTLIVDEAHQFEAALRSAYETKGNSSTLNRLQTQMDKHTAYGSLFQDIVKDWEVAFNRLPYGEGEAPPKPLGAEGAQLLLRLRDVLGAIRFELRLAGFEFSEEVERSVRGFTPKTDAMINHDGFKNIRDKGNLRLDTETLHALHTLEGRLEKVVTFLTSVEDPGDNIVICYERSGSHRLAGLKATPISIAAFAGPKLAMVGKKVFTSGTLAVGDQFHGFIRKLGLRQDVVLEGRDPDAPAPVDGDPPAEERRKAPVITELILPSPFDHKTQTLLYLPRNIPFPVNGPPSPARTAYHAAVAKEIVALLEASKGNAFVLFSARADMEAVFPLVNDSTDYPLIIQEEGSQTSLRQYMATDNAVLFGLKTFWEGVNIPGEKLRLVIITKLPFPPPGDAARKKEEERYRQKLMDEGESESSIRDILFNTFSVEEMLRDVRQGVGRLIRTDTDTGVIAILDTRMYTGSSTKGNPLTASFERPWGYPKKVYQAIESPRYTDKITVVAAQYRAWWNAKAKS